MRNFKYLTFIMMPAYISSGCSTKGDDLCIFGMESRLESYRDYDNPVYRDANGNELSRQAKNEILKQADKYAQNFINEDYDFAEILCFELNTNHTIFETKHIQSKLSDEQVPRAFSVPINYSDSRAAVIQLVKDRNKPYSSRINSGLADVGVINLVVEGPCLNNLCNKKDLVELYKTNQRTVLNDKKVIQKLKTSYIRENGIDITFPKKEKRIYTCKIPNLLSPS